MVRTRELAHVAADLGDDDLGHRPADAGDPGQPLDGITKRAEHGYERRLRQIDREVCAGYYLQLKNYCALKASAKLGCPIIGRHETDLKIQREILSFAKEGDVLRDAVLHDSREQEIHLTTAPHLFKQTEPPLFNAAQSWLSKADPIPGRSWQDALQRDWDEMRHAPSASWVTH